MNLAIATPPISLATSALQILLEALPDCRVVDSREGPIAFTDPISNA
jgi:hypothetical protein